MTNLGEVIKRWRVNQDLGQRGAAKLMGISAATLCRIETGGTTLDTKSLLAIINWLFSESDNGRSKVSER